jgi:hypothetical protein
MHGVAHFEQGIDRSCDATVSRWFKWRFPMLELQRFIACRDWPYTSAYHIIEMEGMRHVFVNLGILTPRLIPGLLRRSRTTRQFKVQLLTGNRLRVSMLIWMDAPLEDSHPLAKLCPSRWPVIDEPTMQTRIGHLTLVNSRLHDAL